MCRSVPQMDATFTLTRTSLPPKAGTLTSRISAPGAAFAFTTASILSDMNLPYEFGFKNKTLNSSIPTTGTTCRLARTSLTALRTLSKHAFLILLSIFPGGKFFRPSARNAQRLPFARSKMFGQENDLSGVLGIVRDLPIDSLHDRMGLAANRDPAHDGLGRERSDGREQPRPAFFPPAHNIRPRCRRGHFEFPVAVAVWLFAIGGQKVG